MVGDKGHQKMNKWLYTRKNIFSAESLHFMIVAIMTSVIIGLGVAVALPKYGIIVGVVLALFILFILLRKFFVECITIYKPLETKVSKEERDNRFNKVFSKAWFLHFY